MQKDIPAQYNTQGSNYCSNQSENQKCNVLTHTKQLFSLQRKCKSLHIIIRSHQNQREYVVERGTYDISLVPHHLYRIPKLRTLEPPPELLLFYKGITK